MDKATRAAIAGKRHYGNIAGKTADHEARGNSLNELLQEEGEHLISYKATDTAVEGNTAARTNTIDWTISVSNANIRAGEHPLSVSDLGRPRNALCRGYQWTYLDPTLSSFFRYRKKREFKLGIDNITAKLGEDQKTITSDEIKGLRSGNNV